MVRKNHRPFWTSSNNIIMSLNSCNRFRQQLSLASRKLLKIEFCLHSMMLNRFISLLSLTEVKSFDPAIQPTLNMYNEYFGGGMNAIVFQEMRESRGLAYSAGAFLITPSKLEISVCIPYVHCDSE